MTKCFFVISIVFFSSLSWGSIKLSEVIVDLSGNKNQADISIENMEKETLYVEITPSKILNPGETPLQRDSSPDPKKLGILVTPNRLVLAPQQQKNMRLVLTEPAGDKERIYRIKVFPKIGKVEMSGKEGLKTTGVKILVGYEVLVIVRPSNMKVELKVERKGNKLLVKNTGNTNVLLWKIQQCDANDKDKNSCHEENGPRVYPGKNVELTLPKDAPAEVYEQIGGDTQVKTY